MGSMLMLKQSACAGSMVRDVGTLLKGFWMWTHKVRTAVNVRVWRISTAAMQVLCTSEND